MTPRAADPPAAPEEENRTTSATLTWACLVSVMAAGLFEVLSPIEDTGVVMVIPVVIACLFLDTRVALLTVGIAVVADLANLRYGATEVEHVVENTITFAVAFPVGRLVGARLGTHRILLPDPHARERLLARLSAREAEVISLVLQGLTAREIGRELALTDRTVETHTAIAYSKLGVHDRAALARLFTGEGGPPGRDLR